MARMQWFLIMIVFSPAFPVFSDDAVISFAESWAVNISAKYVITSFSQEQSPQLTTDRPWAMGLGIRYKNTSVVLLLPSFYVFDENPWQFTSFDFQLSSYYNVFYYEAFCKRYQGFTEAAAKADAQNATGGRDVDLTVFSYGISAGWVLNGARHSLSAAYDLDCRQSSSSGSPIIGIGAFYTSLSSGDTAIKRYGDPRRILYFGPHFGYSYTFIFSRNIFLNMNMVIGLDAGFNRAAQWLFVPLVMPKISFGHHNQNWSINTAAGCHLTALIWDTARIDLLIPSTMTVTFSRRF